MSYKWICKNVIFLIVFCIFNNTDCFAKPYIPKDDSEIVEHLATRISGSLTKELRKLRAQLNQKPDDIDLVLKFAKRCIELSREESDPRYLGYAEAVIKPWLKKDKPLAEIFIISGVIKQSNHDFNGALKELDMALKTEGRNPQAWLTKAQIYLATGEYQNAKSSCAKLLGSTSQLVTIGCLSSVSGLSSDAQKSYEVLKRIEAGEGDSASASEKSWILTLLAEISNRLGDPHSSEEYYKQALRVNDLDNYLLGSYSDFLLENNRAGEVITLLKDKTRIDGLLLRLALAEKSMNATDLKKHIDELKGRFFASHMRRDNVHIREEAIFNLELLNDAKKSLELARKNWKIQKEPLDMNLLLKASIASGDKSAANDVIKFVQKNKIEDKKSAILISKLKGGSS